MNPVDQRHDDRAADGIALDDCHVGRIDARFECHHRLAHADQLAGLAADDREAFGIGDDHWRDHRARFADQQVEIEADQRIEPLHARALGYARGEPAAAERHRVEPDMHQDLGAFGRA